MRGTKHIRTSVTNTPEQTHRGVFSSNKRGFGFVTVEGIKEDFFIPLKYTQNAFYGDIVNIKTIPKSRGKRSEAKITKIISHSVSEVVGTFEKYSSFGFVRPDNPKIVNDIYVERGRDLGAKDGDKVICKIEDYGSVNKKPSGYISEILGDTNDPYIDIKSTARAFGIPMDFNDEVMSEVSKIPAKVYAKDKKGRLDLSDEMIISIDGDDSKDLDDAISLKKEGDFYILGVHIADVSHYVKEDSFIDKEAYKRGTSVYLTDVVIPMLHESLSNGICSLLQDVERLTLSCIMKINKKGEVIDSDINPSFIVNKRRMTYKNVNRILENPKDEKDDSDVVPMLLMMEKLAGILRKNREKRGAIEFDIPESKIVLSKSGLPIEIGERSRGISEKIIEEFMLIANETVAKRCFETGIPMLYRSHPAPESTRIDELRDLCNLMGIGFNVGKKGVTPKDIQAIIKKSKGSEKESLMSTVTLRSMQQARYSAEDTEHFGLAAPFYLHFTSPIRRYPDLLVHRIIKENLKKPLGSRRKKHFTAITLAAGDHTSGLERRAIECEREVDKLKKAQYMKNRIGERYDGIISGVTGWGLYVMLPNTVEGMVPINKIDGDYFVYKEKSYGIFGERTGMGYCIGDRISVEVDSVDISNKTIDFRILNNGKNRKKTNSIKQKSKA